MLKQIENFELSNLKANMKEIAFGSLDKILKQVEDPATNSEIKESAFQSALLGISKGTMTYENDSILPMIEAEMQERLQKFQGLTAEEESKLLALTDDQKIIVADNDRKLKNEFLVQAPAISHGVVKMTDKYKAYVSMVSSK